MAFEACEPHFVYKPLCPLHPLELCVFVLSIQSIRLVGSLTGLDGRDGQDGLDQLIQDQGQNQGFQDPQERRYPSRKRQLTAMAAAALAVE